MWTRQFTAYDTLRVVPESNALLVEGYVGGDDSVLGPGREIWRSARRRDPQKTVACDPGFWNTLIVQDGTVYSTSSRGTVFALAPPR
ncbi:hypothetical protein [Streptomyces sp. NBC_00239]|uniref:hypothetical protein n=1 Tax=Streptomyces sp. NBC_00239 TaxID=2903640 RepID=UPI002E28BDF9|nr:hypothetical protein [Streptomyces sp. NBC_00239]